MADSVGCSSVPAVVPSFAAMAVRRRFMMVRTRVRLARLISARTWDCLARLITEGLRFFTLVVAPCAIQNLLFLLCGRGHSSQSAKSDGITLSEAHLFVNEPGKWTQRNERKLPAQKAGGRYKGNRNDDMGL